MADHLRKTGQQSPVEGPQDPGRRRVTGALFGAGAAGLSGPALLAAMNGPAQAQAAGEPIMVGGAMSLTGWGAGDGIETRRGLEMAAEEINALGGILGRPLEVVIEDTKEQGADNVIQAIQRLIDRHGVHVIVNGYNGGTLTAEYDTVADAGIIYIHQNTDIIHHQTISSDPDRYFGTFMSDPAEWWYGKGLFEFLTALEKSGTWTRPNGKVFIITGSDNNTVTIGNAMTEAAKEYEGWEISVREVVVTPISEWGPTLAKIREDKPAVIAMCHWVAQDQAQFMLQFTPNPTDSLIYMQYGPSLQAFRDIGGQAVTGVTYSSVVAQLQDEIGLQFADRYRAKFGPDSTPMIGSQTYDALWHWAISAAQAGGTAGPGGHDQNRKVSDALRRTIYRGVQGVTRYWRDGALEKPWPYQAAIPYPNDTKDPSLGMPHQYFQIQDITKPPVIITPTPYETGIFVTPPWIKA